MSTASRPVNSQMPAAKVTASDRLGQIRSSGEVPVTTQISDRIQKPRLRGILHLMAFPVSVIASMVLIALAPSGELKIGASIYALSTMLLFGNSAMLHVGRWGRRMNTILCQIDYANIFIIIAGTNTVFPAHASYPASLDVPCHHLVRGVPRIRVSRHMARKSRLALHHHLCGSGTYGRTAPALAVECAEPWPRGHYSPGRRRGSLHRRGMLLCDAPPESFPRLVRIS
jgi:hypothetical protein